MNHAKDIIKKFGLDNEEEVMNLIKEALKNGENTGINPNGFYEIVYNQGGKKLKIIISATDSKGSIQSAYPI